MKTHLIIQRFGIGDVIFSMTAIRSLKGKVVWPVLPEYVDGLAKAYQDILFIDYNLLNIDWNRKDRYKISDMNVIPLAHQDVPLVDCMKNKYRYLMQDWKQWKKNASWTRDYSKEIGLMSHLGIRKGDKFNLVNTKFGCWSPEGLRPETSNISIEVPMNNLPYITFGIIPGYSLFDWASVIEHATNIYTVSTSLLYLLELLTLSAKEIHLYPRKPKETDFRNVDYVFSKPYILHE
jgi:hypothetical protein